MKDFKKRSDTTLARFGRDKRGAYFLCGAIERRPRLQRDAADFGALFGQPSARILQP